MRITGGWLQLRCKSGGAAALKFMKDIRLSDIKENAGRAARQLIEAANLSKGDIFVVGCSSSEVLGDTIGTASSVEAAEAVFNGIYEVISEKQLYLAAQCCEHLNRALIIETELAKRERIPIVNVVPKPKAGGSFATAAYSAFKHPAAVEHIKAQAGMDIGDTLIGMHLDDVAVPVRIEVKEIGAAHLVCARTRPKFIGGQRAGYDENIM